MSEREAGFEGWVILELMGHRRLGGKVSEATIAGAAFVRIDVPHLQDLRLIASTRYFSPTAIYSITPTTEAVARAVASGTPEPVSLWDVSASDVAAEAIGDDEGLAAGDEPF